MSENDDELLDAFELPADGAEHPATIAARVLRLDEHQHLADAELRFLWLMRNTEHVQGGRQIIGMVHEVDVKGRLRDLFFQMLVATYGFMPDYIVTLDSNFWRDATPVQREALVHHELSHVKQALDRHGEPRINQKTGEPVFCLVAHDLEEFQKTVERYGAWKSDITDFVEALNRHG